MMEGTMASIAARLNLSCEVVVERRKATKANGRVSCPPPACPAPSTNVLWPRVGTHGGTCGRRLSACRRPSTPWRGSQLLFAQHHDDAPRSNACSHHYALDADLGRSRQRDWYVHREPSFRLSLTGPSLPPSSSSHNMQQSRRQPLGVLGACETVEGC